MLPINGAKLTLIETGETYTADTLQNGVFVFKNLTPGIYHVKAEKEGYYTKTQEITVSRHNISWINLDLNRIRNTAPEVIQYSPNVSLTDSVDASTSILLEFNWDMDEASTAAAFSITPTVEGKITFEDTQYKMRFTPTFPLEKSTIYTVKLAKTASHPDNLSMNEDFSFQFITKSRNRLELLGSYPNTSHQQVHYNSPSFRLIFDKKLNTSNLQTAVKILDSNRQVVSKNARSVENNKIMLPYGSTYFRLIDNLKIGEKYFLVVDGTVKDEVGVSVVETIEIPFTAVDALTGDLPIVESFENLSFTYNAAMSQGASNATSSVNSATRLAGSNSLKLTATLDPGGIATFAAATPVNFTWDDVAGLHIFGDLSGNLLELEFSALPEIRYIPLCTTGFYGWEFHEVELSSLEPETTYALTGIRINRSLTYPWSASSEIYLDNLLKYNDPISSTPALAEDQLLIYPNPADHWITTNLADARLRLYTLTGQLVRKAQSTMMIDDLDPGSYLIRIESGSNNYLKKVVIR